MYIRYRVSAPTLLLCAYILSMFSRTMWFVRADAQSSPSSDASSLNLLVSWEEKLGRRDLCMRICSLCTSNLQHSVVLTLLICSLSRVRKCFSSKGLGRISAYVYGKLRIDLQWPLGPVMNVLFDLCDLIYPLADKIHHDALLNYLCINSPSYGLTWPNSNILKLRLLLNWG